MFWKRVPFLVVMLIASCAANAETLSGRVVGVSDGDTITVLDGSRQQHKIRLLGVDPEKAMPFGQRSKESLSRLVFERDEDVVWRKKKPLLTSPREDHGRRSKLSWDQLPKDTGCVQRTDRGRNGLVVPAVRQRTGI